MNELSDGSKSTATYKARDVFVSSVFAAVALFAGIVLTLIEISFGLGIREWLVNLIGEASYIQTAINAVWTLLLVVAYFPTMFLLLVVARFYFLDEYDGQRTIWPAFWQCMIWMVIVPFTDYGLGIAIGACVLVIISAFVVESMSPVWGVVILSAVVSAILTLSVWILEKDDGSDD